MCSAQSNKWIMEIDCEEININKRDPESRKGVKKSGILGLV